MVVKKGGGGEREEVRVKRKRMRSGGRAEERGKTSVLYLSKAEQKTFLNDPCIVPDLAA